MNTLKTFFSLPDHPLCATVIGASVVPSIRKSKTFKVPRSARLGGDISCQVIFDDSLSGLVKYVIPSPLVLILSSCYEPRSSPVLRLSPPRIPFLPLRPCGSLTSRRKHRELIKFVLFFVLLPENHFAPLFLFPRETIIRSLPLLVHLP